MNEAKFIVMVKAVNEQLKTLLNGREYVNLLDENTGRYNFEFTEYQATKFDSWSDAEMACRKMMWYAFEGLMDEWPALRRRVFASMEGFDAVLAPVCATPAMPHGTVMRSGVEHLRRLCR